MNDVECKLSAGLCDFGTAETKDCLMDYSNCIRNEGNLTINLSLVLCCVHARYFWYYYSIFIRLFVFHITGCGTSEPFHGDKDMIDLKVEPSEVSDVC